jgi:TolB protein
VASIGPSEAGQSSFMVPFGPLRLLDADTGHVRTLIDGSVASFWWSPDGRTIAALRVQPVASGSTSRPKPSPSPAVTGPSASAPSARPPAAEEPTEIRLVFADVASGKQTSTVVQPGRLYIDQFLTYFDQYARSHRVWSPDSSSILVPVDGPDGTTRISVLHRNGEPAVTIDGAIGFWSP